MATIRISAPDTARKGEVIEIKALIQHPMETGYRSDSKGEEIPRDIIARFECVYGGETVFAADFGPGIAPDLAREIMDGTAAPAAGSSGLGLAGCRALARANGGYIEIEDARPGTRLVARMLTAPATGSRLGESRR